MKMMMTKRKSRKRTKMGNEDDKEAAVLIGKLVMSYRLILILLIVWVLLFSITFEFYGFYLIKILFFFGGWFFIGTKLSRFLQCPFCRKPVLWKPHESGLWMFGTYLLFLPKKCPHCSRSLRVKKKKGTATLQK